MTSGSNPLRGIIFDLDGTLVDSQLDFDQMRAEMELPAGLPILEAISQMPEPRASECRAILTRHELAGVERATAMPGVHDLLAELHRRRLRLAVLTRNSRAIAEATLQRCGLEFDEVIGREDAPAKPDPTAILQLCARWELGVHEVAMIGDNRFDLEAGRAAGSRTVLYTAGEDLRNLDWAQLADLHLPCFSRPAALLALI